MPFCYAYQLHGTYLVHLDLFPGWVGRSKHDRGGARFT